MKQISTLNSKNSKQQIKLQIELIINRNLYKKNKIMKDTYLKVEQDILRAIQQEKQKFES